VDGYDKIKERFARGWQRWGAMNREYGSMKVGRWNFREGLLPCW